MLVRLIIWLIVGFLIYTVFQAIKQRLLKPPSPPPEKTARGEEMARDPECGTYVPRSDALKAQAKGATYYFCSAACRDKYLERS
jgi:YHS domain-containing protein